MGRENENPVVSCSVTVRCSRSMARTLSWTFAWSTWPPAIAASSAWVAMETIGAL